MGVCGEIQIKIIPRLRDKGRRVFLSGPASLVDDLMAEVGRQAESSFFKESPGKIFLNTRNRIAFFCLSTPSFREVYE